MKSGDGGIGVLYERLRVKRKKKKTDKKKKKRKRVFSDATEYLESH